MGVISAMVEKNWGERNFGFDSLKSRLNRDVEEKGIVARECLSLPAAEESTPRTTMRLDLLTYPYQNKCDEPI